MSFVLSPQEYQKCLRKHSLSLYQITIPNSYNSCSVYYYIGKTLLTLKEYKKCHKDLVGYIHTLVDFQDDVITVLEIQTTIGGCGFGTLLVCVATINAGQKNIELDDMSDNFRKPNNIYRNIGLEYIENGMPEMIGSTHKIRELWKTLSLKYF